MITIDKCEQIADYAWLGKGRLYWTLWIGNPFVTHAHEILIKDGPPRAVLVADAKYAQGEMRFAFTAKFPGVEWKAFRP